MEKLERTASLIRFVFHAPSPLTSTVAILVVSIIAGVLIFPETNFLIKLYYLTFLFLLPTIISAVISKPFAELLKGLLYLRRSFLLALLSLVFLAIITFGVKLLTNNLAVSLILGCSSILWLRHVVIVSISNSSHLRSLPASISQPLLGLSASFVIFEFTPRELIIAILTLVIFLVSAFSFIELAKLRFKKNYNINALDLLKATLAHFTTNSLELERFFETRKEELNAEIDILCFRSARSKELKAVVVVPEKVHPGPFGKLCGSDLPSKLQAELSYPLFVLHSCSTHDYNPATSKECFKIATALKEAISEISEYSSSTSQHVAHSSNTAIVSAQYFNDALLLVCSFEKPVDDIEEEVGNRIISMVGSEKIIVADSHNYVVPNAPALELDLALSSELIEAARKVYLKVGKQKSNELKVGVGLRNVSTPELGALGIRALVVEVNGQKTGYIIFDGNGMLKDTRAKLKSAILDSGILDAVELLTTDNHAVNLTMHGFNPIGSSGMDYTNITKEVIQEAVNDLEEVEVANAKKAIKINVAGRGSALKLTSTINSTISLLKILFPVIVIVTALVCAIVIIYL
ncbi:MAG: DUF2070 family protein [Candidatus Thermoplasmatota archaeon]